MCPHPSPAEGRAGTRSRLILSVLTVAWLAGQGWAVATYTFETWPVTELSFFSEGYDEGATAELTGVTSDGRVFAMTALGFGLEPHQLDLWLSRRLGPFPDERDPHDLETLAQLARIWNDEHADQEVVGVRLRIKRVPIPGQREPSGNETVLAWGVLP